MAKQGATTVTPRLRFPDFREATGWTQTSLGLEATFQKGRGISKAELDPNGNRLCIRYGELYTRYGEIIDVVVSRTNAPESELFLSRTNDVIIPASGETKADIATASCVLLDGVALGSDLNVIRTPHNGVFLSYLLNGSKRGEIAKLAQGDTVVHLYPSQLSPLQIGFPQKAEQQKIADCLMSLDEVIAAQGRKVEALRAHKRGLLQQLFPREGEHSPYLRFPKFREAPDWKVRALGSMTTKVGSGITPLGGDKNYKSEGRPFVRSQNVGWGQLLLEDIAFIDESTHASFGGTEIAESDVLLNITGASIGRSAVADARIAGGNVNQHVCIIRTKQDELNPRLLNQFLISEQGQEKIASFQAGGNRQGLNFTQIRSLEIPLPPSASEQDRIADCLSSLDTQIAAEFDQLAALKTHKQGLMQQLFPAPEEN